MKQDDSITRFEEVFTLLVLEELIVNILKILTREMDVERAFVIWQDREMEGFNSKTLEIDGRSVEDADLGISDGNIIEMLSKMDPQIVDINGMEEFSHSPYQIRSLLYQSIEPCEGVKAILMVANRLKGEEFSEDDCVFLSRISRYSSLAIKNIKTYETIKRRAIGLSAVQAINRFINTTLGLDRLLKEVVDLIAKMMRVDLCSIMLADEEGNELSIAAAIGLGEEIIKKTRIRKGEGISGWVLLNGKSLLLRNIEEDPIFARPNNSRYTTRSLLSAPMKVKGRVIGVISVNNKEFGKIFVQEDEEILSALAGQLAISIESATLYSKVERLASLGRMAARISHGLRNPLATIKLTSQYLRKRFSQEDPVIPQRLTVIEKEVDAADRIIEDIRDFSSPTRLVVNSINVNEIIEDVLSSLGDELLKKDIVVVKELDPKIPLTLGDRDRLSETFMNIVTNGIQAMEAGGQLRVATQMEERAESIEIVLGDTGPGMSRDVIQRMFDPFFSTKPRGLGLGLAIASDIISGHHGRIDVESEPGRGTTLTITLPVSSNKGGQ